MKRNEIAFYLLKSIHFQSDDRRHVADCAQKIFQKSFDHVDNLEAFNQNFQTQ